MSFPVVVIENPEHDTDRPHRAVIECPLCTCPAVAIVDNTQNLVAWCELGHVYVIADGNASLVFEFATVGP
jgi:hypothetical protein